MGLVDEKGNPIQSKDAGMSPLGNPNGGTLDGTRWDKDAPTAPPDPVVRAIPEWFRPVHDFIATVVHDEAHVLDLCLEECLDMVQFNFTKGAVGIDLFGEDGAGSGVTRGSLLALATQLAPALYKEVLAALELRKEILHGLIVEAKKHRDAGGTSGS